MAHIKREVQPEEVIYPDLRFPLSYDFCFLLKIYLTVFRRVSALRSAISALAISTFSACP